MASLARNLRIIETGIVAKSTKIDAPEYWYIYSIPFLSSFRVFLKTYKTTRKEMQAVICVFVWQNSPFYGHVSQLDMLSLINTIK